MDRQKGFTTLSLLVGLAIMGALSLGAMPYLVEYNETAKAAGAKTHYYAVVDATIRYNQDTAGKWPSSLDDFTKDPGVSGWAGPYLSVNRVSNAWGGTNSLVKDTTTFKVGTAGRTTNTKGSVLYLEFTNVHDTAAKKLDVLIDGEASSTEGHVQYSSSDGVATVKILVYDIP